MQLGGKQGNPRELTPVPVSDRGEHVRATTLRFERRRDKNGAEGAVFLLIRDYFLMRMIGVSPTVTLPDSLISSLISSMLEITTGVRVDLAFLPAEAG